MDDLNTRVFRKMGWERLHKNDLPHPEMLIEEYHWCSKPKDILSGVVINKLPPISSSWEVCAEYLVPFMREREFYYFVSYMSGSDFPFFSWEHEDLNMIRQIKIKNDNIALAACEAFMEIKL